MLAPRQASIDEEAGFVSTNMLRLFALTGLATALAAFGVSTASAAGPSLSVVGTATNATTISGDPVWRSSFILSVQAFERDGRTFGRATRNVGEATYRVLDIRPPAPPERDYWCVHSRNDEPFAFEPDWLFFLRDTGDGTSAQDQIGLTGGWGIDCTFFDGIGTPSPYFFEVPAGDFRARMK